VRTFLRGCGVLSWRSRDDEADDLGVETVAEREGAGGRGARMCDELMHGMAECERDETRCRG
jgi:hypothetical protein